MAVDKSYGSGKSRSAANSRSRQRVAAGNFTKGAKPLARGLKKIAAENPVTGFVNAGVSVIKLGKVAGGLFNAGKFAASEAVGSRVYAKRIGALRAANLSGRSGKTPASNLSPRLLASAQRGRRQSESLFPRATKTTGSGNQPGRGYGRVDQQGLEKMIIGGREPSREMLRIPKILKATNTAYENIAQKAIKRRGR